MAPPSRKASADCPLYFKIVGKKVDTSSRIPKIRDKAQLAVIHPHTKGLKYAGFEFKGLWRGGKQKSAN